MQTLGQAIRTAREGKGWSRATLSDASGVGTSTIARLELYNNPPPKIGTLRALTKALGLRLSDVLEEDAA